MLSSLEMSQLLVGCPLCCQATFSSTNALCIALITVASKTLKCPICDEALCGLDKLTIHLLSHLLSQSRDHCINKGKSRTTWHLVNENVKKSNDNSMSSIQFIDEHDKFFETVKNKFCITDKCVDSGISEENINKPIEDIIQSQKIVVGDEVMLVFDKTKSQHQETNEYFPTNLSYNTVSSEDSSMNIAFYDSNQYKSSLVLSNVQPVQDNYNSETCKQNHSSKSIANILTELHLTKDCTENEKALDNLEHSTSKDKTTFRDNSGTIQTKFGNQFDLLGSIAQSDGLTNSLLSIDKTKINIDDSGSDVSAQYTKAGYLDNLSSSPANEQILKFGSGSLSGLECEKCSVRFIDHKLLSVHQVLAHSNENSDEKKKTYSCKLCTKSFKMKGSLIVHTKVAHSAGSSVLSKLLDATKKKEAPSVSSNVSPYTCAVCGKGFRKEQHLVQHEKTHEGKQWDCDFCGKTFTTKYFLKKHHLLHTGETPYTCTTCNKSFTFQQSYHKHLLYHSDDKPYQCNECGRSFKELSTLHNHQRIHTGEKPYSCETCGKCFRQRVSYLVHRRIHTGDMPYKCSECNKSFRYKVSERTHKCGVTVNVANKSNNEPVMTLTLSKKMPEKNKIAEENILLQSSQSNSSNQPSSPVQSWLEPSCSSTNKETTNLINNNYIDSTDFLSLIMSPTYQYTSDKLENLRLSCEDSMKWAEERKEPTNSPDKLEADGVESVYQSSLKELLYNVADYN